MTTTHEGLMKQSPIPTQYNVMHVAWGLPTISGFYWFVLLSEKQGNSGLIMVMISFTHENKGRKMNEKIWKIDFFFYFFCELFCIWTIWHPNFEQWPKSSSIVNGPLALSPLVPVPLAQSFVTSSILFWLEFFMNYYGLIMIINITFMSSL